MAGRPPILVCPKCGTARVRPPGASQYHCPTCKRSRKPPLLARSSTATSSQTVPGEVPEEDRKWLEILADETEDKVKLAEAAVALSANRLRRAQDAGSSARATEDLNRSLKELRSTTKAVREEREARKELLPREEGEAAVGELGARFVRAFERVATKIGTQVEVWLADKTFLALATVDRTLAVRKWSLAVMLGERMNEVEELKKLLVNEGV